MSWTKWISWILQCVSYAAGIILSVRELFFRAPVRLKWAEKGMADLSHQMIPQVDWVYMVAIVGVLVVVTLGMREWRKR